MTHVIRTAILADSPPSGARPRLLKARKARREIADDPDYSTTTVHTAPAHSSMLGANRLLQFHGIRIPVRVAARQRARRRLREAGMVRLAASLHLGVDGRRR